MEKFKSIMKKLTFLRKPLTNVFVGLLVFFFFANSIAGQFAHQINLFLKIRTSIVVSDDADAADKPYRRYYESVYSSVAELKAAGLAKTQEVVAEGAVLLKNNGVLPLKGKTVSLFGAAAADPVYGGTGSGAVDTSGAPTFVGSFESAGLTVVNKPLMDWYTSQSSLGRPSGKAGSTKIGEASWRQITQSPHAGLHGKGEVAVFVVGRVGGEGEDLSSTGHFDGGKNPLNPLRDNLLSNKANDYLMLSSNELLILEGLKALKDAPGNTLGGIVVIFNSANPLAGAFLSDPKYGVDAALWVGSVGQNGIYAVGDILTGAVNPSGSLPDTWWQNNLLNPVMANFGSYTYEHAANYRPGESNTDKKFTSYVVYQEGIYLGYKYTETRYEDKVMGREKTGDFVYNDVVAFPFGYGLSYSDFTVELVGNLEVEGTGTDKTYIASVKVTNNNDTPGKKTVQIYAQKPYTSYDITNKIEKAAVELVGYGKTEILKKNESETVKISIPEYFLTSYDALGEGVYVLNNGTYYLTAADNSHEAVNNILAKKGKTVANGMTANGNAGLVYSITSTFDKETYSKAYGTGEKVTSLFAHTDINRYEGKESNGVKYVSRNDWEGTLKFWGGSSGENDNFEKLSMTAKMYADSVLDASDLPVNDNNWPVMGSTKTGYKLIDLKDAKYDDLLWQDLLDQLTYAELSALCATGLRMTYEVPSIVKPRTMDHNGPSGVTQKYNNTEGSMNGYANVNNDPNKDMTGTCYPCNGIIAATMNDKLVQEVGEMIGEDGMWAGYAGLYGSGLNIHRSPYSGRVFEYFSEDGMLTGLIDTHKTIGIQSKGVYVYNKHFVLNDQELQRSGLGTWVSEQALREIYLRAFELPIVNADAKCVMTAFNRMGAIWAGADRNLLENWLRTEAGMSGFAVTDMYEGDYMSKPHELLAGNDIPDNIPGTSGTGGSGGNNDMGFEFAAYGPNGATPNAQIARAMRVSAKRILYTVLHSRGMDGIDSKSRIVTITPWWQTLLTVSIIVLAVLSALLIAWLVVDMIPRRKKTTISN